MQNKIHSAIPAILIQEQVGRPWEYYSCVGAGGGGWGVGGGGESLGSEESHPPPRNNHLKVHYIECTKRSTCYSLLD